MKHYKIAIMTWFTYRNYGSILQASALAHVIKKMNYDVTFINYLPKGGVASNPKLDLVKRTINKIKKGYTSAEYEKCYNEYLQEKIDCTPICTSYPELHDLNKEYDAFVCGSDQIWSPFCYDSKYFLDFVENTDKMIAYAPSIGSTKIDDAIIRERMSKDILRFKYLSVREEQGADLIKQLTGQVAKVVIDPTLLMNHTEWDTFVNVEKTKKIQGQYILCYFLGDEKKYMRYVCKLSKKLEIPFYIIPVTMHHKSNNNVVPFEVGPSEFVSLIRNATYVCTDSFHGTAFSVNYNIPFSVFKRFKDNDPKNQNSRIFNLLNQLHLENRLVDYRKIDDVNLEDDFYLANKLLEKLRNESLEYLKQSLQEASSSEIKNSAQIKITDVCCGCGACETVCAQNAISIERNDEGFEQCKINEEICVKCGVCTTVCPMTNILAPQIKEAKALYSVKSCSEQVLKISSSGGVGYEIAKMLYKKGYAICGCKYDSTDNSAKHIWVMQGEEEKIHLLQGSKYIQSISVNALNKLVDIIQLQPIVFFGTPCQVAAVDRILSEKKMRNRAVLVDLICHGVPSYYLWEKYLRDINEKYSTGANPQVLFRYKEQEWRRRLLLVYGENTYKRDERKDNFYAFFRRGLCYMKACSDCPYRERSAADIRIGDYWGKRFVDDKQGVSMVIANSDKGDSVVETLEELHFCEIYKQKLDEYWSVQFPYNQSRPLIREKLIVELRNDNTKLDALRKKYCTYYDREEFVLSIAYRVKNCLHGDSDDT